MHPAKGVNDRVGCTTHVTNLTSFLCKYGIYSCKLLPCLRVKTYRMDTDIAPFFLKLRAR